MKRALAIAFLAATACGRVAGDAPEPRPPAADGEQLYEANTTVLEDATHGPELCVGGVMESLPPQCGGVPITNWSWGRVEGEESMSGSRWGEFHVIGTYDGDRFTVTEVGEYRTPTGEDFDSSMPCPEPEGGWVAHDPQRTTEKDRSTAIRSAERQPDHAGTWVQTIDGEPVRVVNEEMILIVAFTGDLERHEAELRTLWGGPVCVVQHAHSQRDLMDIQQELSDDPPFGLEVTWTDVNVFENRVEAGVIVADEAARASLDERYGPGVVEVHPALRPVS